MYPTIQEIIGCDIHAGQVPFFDGKCWSFIDFDLSCEDLKNCSFWTTALPFLWTSVSMTIADNDITITSISLDVSLNGNSLTIGNKIIDLSPILTQAGFYITNDSDTTGRLGIGDGSTIYIQGLDGLVVTTNAGNISLGLPIPMKIYTTPGPNPDSPIKMNEVQVLTWDECKDKAMWMPPQCCLPPLVFNEGVIGFGSGGASITGVNTDGQILKYDPLTDKNKVYLTASHGAGIPDPDSVVDLEFVNEQTLNLSGNILNLIGSSGNTYSYINLSGVNRHYFEIDLSTNTLELFGSDGVSLGTETLIVNNQYLGIEQDSLKLYNSKNELISSVELSSVNNHVLAKNMGGALEELEIANSALFVTGSVEIQDINRHTFDLNGSILSILDVNGEHLDSVNLIVNPHTILLNTVGVDNSLELYNSLGTLLSTVPLDEVANKHLELSGTVLSVEQGESDCCSSGVDLAFMKGLDCDDVRDCMDLSINAINIKINKVTNNINNIIKEADKADKTLVDVAGDIQTQEYKLFNSRRYYAKIWISNNRTQFNPDPDPDLDTLADYEAKWFFPNFDMGMGYGVPLNEIINPANFLAASQTNLHIGSLFNKPIPVLNPNSSNYHSTPSTNNVLCAGHPELSDCCPDGSYTITIPKTGMWSVSLQGVCKVDHNVHAYRYSCLRYKSQSPDRPISVVIDTKFGGAAGLMASGSLNNELYPCVKYYQHGGTKNVWLQKGDVLFVGIKMDSRTRWPKILETTSGNHGQTLLSGTKHYADLMGATTGMTVNDSCDGCPTLSDPGHTHGIDYNNTSYGWKDDGGTQLPRPAAYAPNISPEEYPDPIFLNGGESAYGINNYKYRLNFPTRDPSVVGYSNVYRLDDGVITLLGPSNFSQSDGSGAAWQYEEELTNRSDGGASLSVHRLNTDNTGEPFTP